MLGASGVGVGSVRVLSATAGAPASLEGGPGGLPRWAGARPAWPWLAVAAAALGAYVLSVPGNRTEADDAFLFAEEVEGSPWPSLIERGHVRHLLFLPASRLLLYGTRAVGLDLGAYDVMRWASTVAAALAVAGFGIVLERRFGLTRTVAMTAAAGLAVSYGFWRYANEAEVTSFSALATVALLWVVAADRPSAWRGAVAGALGALSILVHVLALVPALTLAPWALWRATRRAGGPLLAYAAALVTIVAGAYATAFTLAAPSGQSLWAYLFSDDPISYSAAGLLKVPIGWSQSLVSAMFAFAFEPVTRLMSEHLPAFSFAEEQFAAERAGALATVVAPLTLVAFAGACGALLWRVVWRPPSPRPAGPDLRFPAGAALVWLGAYAAVVVGRTPEAPEAWILSALPLWIVAAVAVIRPALAAGHVGLVAAVVAALFLHNLVGLAVLGGADDDLYARRASWLASNAAAADTVLTAGPPTFARYLRYHVEARVVDLTELSPSERLAALENVPPGGELFATEDVFDEPAHRASRGRFEVADLDGEVGAVYRRVP